MKRFRNRRASAALRDRYAETGLAVKDLVNPYFVAEGKGRREPIKGFYGVRRFSVDELLKAIRRLRARGVDKVLLFGAPDASRKDECGSAAWAEDGVVPRAAAAVKKAFPDVTVMTDVCLCAYTGSGHCGVVSGGKVLNDETLPLLAKVAVAHARAGADVVAPSAMMDGQVGAIRRALDREGLRGVEVMGYSAKYASALYGPFREAEKSSPSFGDRKTYQMDYRNLKEALAEVEADIKEGAGTVMVKPAHAYLDVIRAVRAAYPKTRLAAYHVSGEYAMLKAAARAGVFEENAAVMEVLTAIKRAGADLVITYFAEQAAGLIRGKR